ncbi:MULTISPECIES: dipeptidase [unclassified Okeania]|uniref:dipeptidase n=1 Tax=unclassified Okeania TaxID=2634635 RepID=UPI0013BBB231|nr:MULTISPECIES: dipeptidase [unclassified Okeania]NES78029.1 membrane dipeptidase [Okeania sp. SIO1H4]NET13869.1 membrane dipeptidase [Okeania sp. SIO1H6]NET21884.1 membrane dipeptidase [Okeania sp. SIO1H5]NET94799.1 membrane dipeptidase [Okeania sp. SIO1H2]
MNLSKNQVLSLSIILLSFTVNGCTISNKKLPPSPEVTQEQQQKALTPEEIHEKVLTIDSHIDWPYRQFLDPDFQPNIRHLPGKLGSGQWDIVRMQEGGLDAVFMSIFTPQKERDRQGHEQAKAKAIKMIEITKKMAEENSDKVEIALNPEDAERLDKMGKIAIFMGIENGYPIGKDISNVKFFYDQGIRYITITHSKNNELADSSTDKKQEWNGLSDLGEKVVKEMNSLGIMVDISHVHDDTFWDVIKLTKAPVIASHSSARQLENHPRNMSDEMLKAVKENGGVVQVCIFDTYIKKLPQTAEREKAMKTIAKEITAYWQGKLSQVEIEKFREKYDLINDKYPKNQPTVTDVVDHIDYMVKVMGINHVGIGSDLDGGGGVRGMNDVSEMPNITKELVARGYTEEDIQKIWGGNLMRVFSEAQKVAREIQNQEISGK